VIESEGNLQRAATGIPGLDDILGGGLPEHRLYLVRGNPGVGKTTLALQFLLAGVPLGERVLYITLSETEAEIRQVAASHGWSLDGVSLFELSSAEQTLRLDDENTLYAPEDVDLKETVRVLLEQVQSVDPHRVVFDSLSEIRLLAQTSMRYRRQLLALKQFFAERDCTVMLLDDHASDGEDQQVASLAHGVLALEQTAATYGADRRRLRVVKLRGSPFRSGYHDFRLRKGGLVVYPRLTAAEHRTTLTLQPIGSDVPELDAMLGGGIDRATCTLLMGPAGIGKSSLATQFALAANRRGEAASIFLFEERIGTWRHRCRHLGMDVETAMDNGLLKVHQVDPAELAPDEFTHLVRADIEAGGARLVVIDSITGYLNAMVDGKHLSLQLHELLGFLSERQVASIVTMAQSGLIGSNMVSPVDISYLADTIVLLRYYESAGRVRKAMSVLKKRAGGHEDSIRELGLGSAGVNVGPPLSGMHGVLSGVPRIFNQGQDSEQALTQPGGEKRA
jgi:circadian clock protein KaiC